MLPTLLPDTPQVMASKMTLSGDVDFQQIAKKTPGFVGADLSSLTKEAAVVAINRIFTRLRAESPPAASFAPSPAQTSSAGLPLEPDEAPGKGGVSYAEEAAGEVAARAAGTTKGSSQIPAATHESGSSSSSSGGVIGGGGSSNSADEGTVMNGSGGSAASLSNNAVKPLSPPPPPPSSSVASQLAKKATGAVSGGGGGAEAVGGFLAGPLSAEQLAPLSVTMEDFLMAVKKVRACCLLSLWKIHETVFVLGGVLECVIVFTFCVCAEAVLSCAVSGPAPFSLRELGQTTGVG